MRCPRRSFLLLLGTIALLGSSLTLPRTSAAQQTEVVERAVAATHDGWSSTGIDLAGGESAHIVATGRASWDGSQSDSGPDGSSIEWCRPIVPELPVGALLARVDAGRPVLANGAQVKGPGTLSLAYNDCAGQFFDNNGAFNVTMHVSRIAPPATPAPQSPSAPVEAGSSADGSTTDDAGQGLPILPIIGLIAAAILGGGGWMLLRRLASKPPLFDESARVQSSAWLAPVYLRDRQGGRRPKRALTIGGPDADIDFGIAGIGARLVPTIDGGARIEVAEGLVRITVNDMPLILGQRLGPGSRVRIGMREFVYHEDRRPVSRPGDTKQPTVLDKPDPRAVA